MPYATKQGQKESAYELQRIDCNCNDCGFMQRDLNKQKVQDLFHEGMWRLEYNRNMNDALFVAYTFRDKTALAKLFKQTFKFKKPNMGYGFCRKFDFKEISFIPNTCQLETQFCFIHRKDYNDVLNAL